MADVFISYSQQDREQVRLLAAFLEAEGYAVWWDTNLEIADDFSEEILKQLELARAVIVVWTENSVGSQFVRAEAQIANQNKKIIPVMAKGVDYESLRPPFNVLHTEELSNYEAILAAVEKQIAKPPEAPPLWKQARYQLFSWAGILGTAITLAANIEGLVRLAEWAQKLIESWIEILIWFWTTVLFFISGITKLDAITFTSITLFAGAFLSAFRRREPANISKISPASLLGLVLAMCIIGYVLFLGFSVTFASDPKEFTGWAWDARLNTHVRVERLRTSAILFSIFNEISENLTSKFNSLYFIKENSDTSYSIIVLFLTFAFIGFVCVVVILLSDWKLDIRLVNKRLWQILILFFLILGLNYASLELLPWLKQVGLIA